MRWQDRRVTWQRQTRRWEAPGEDGEQRAGEGTQAAQQQGEGGAGGGSREAFWQTGHPEGLKSYRASQWGLRLVEGGVERKGWLVVGGSSGCCCSWNVVAKVELSARLFSAMDPICWGWGRGTGWEVGVRSG